MTTRLRVYPLRQREKNPSNFAAMAGTSADPTLPIANLTTTGRSRTSVPSLRPTGRGRPLVSRPYGKISYTSSPPSSTPIAFRTSDNLVSYHLTDNHFPQTDPPPNLDSHVYRGLLERLDQAQWIFSPLVLPLPAVRPKAASGVRTTYCLSAASGFQDHQAGLRHYHLQDRH